ncbi:MAG: phosphatase PAP2 family protein [Solirubrobacterales bacterium]|nr:phosphatase PAP2 family protein [Solirubrobacterales bacterium]
MTRRLAGAADRRLMQRWTRRRPQPTDELLLMISQAADRSLLWLAIAATGSAFGGKRGRRAAERGVLALAVASATVNGPFKLLVGRRRPAPIRRLRRVPRSSSFPSGHSASAFAFAVAATRELPQAGVLLLPLAASVAYSRVYLGLHHPSDVAAGAAFGAAVGTAARAAAGRLGLGENGLAQSTAASLPSETVLVVSPRAGSSRGLARARRALVEHGIEVTEELNIEHLNRLPGLLRTAAGEPRLVIAAGGDGTVGSVAGHLARADNVLGILPLGTGNDFARSLDIPMNPARAAALLATGQISSVDLGRLTRAGQPPSYFAHAATVGLNVDFAKLATRASARARLGRLTYLAAAVYAVRERATFQCTLELDGVVDKLTLLQLSVISARVIGGALGLNLKGPHPDDHLLDVLAVEDVPPPKMLRAGLFLLLGIKRPVPGVRALHVKRVYVESELPLELTIDGELDGALPGQFDAVAGAIRVITPRDS